MSITSVLSYLGGYYNSTTFELDMFKVADVSESSEDELNFVLQELSLNGDISIDNDMITLITILPEINERFNELYSPVETVKWDKNTMLKLDK